MHAVYDQQALLFNAAYFRPWPDTRCSGKYLPLWLVGVTSDAESRTRNRSVCSLRKFSQQNYGSGSFLAQLLVDRAVQAGQQL